MMGEGGGGGGKRAPHNLTVQKKPMSNRVKTLIRLDHEHDQECCDYVHHPGLRPKTILQNFLNLCNFHGFFLTCSFLFLKLKL